MKDDNKCMMNFQFDWNEVFEGVKQGVIRELSEANFESIVNMAVSDVKNEFRNKIRLTYSDENQIRDEIKKEIEEKVLLTLIQETKNQYSDMLLNKYKKLFIDSDIEFNDIKKQVVWKLKEDLYHNIYSEIKTSVVYDVKEKLYKSFDGIFGRLISVQNSSQTISQEEYEELCDASGKFYALERWGVANWTGYDDAMHEYHSNNGE